MEEKKDLFDLAFEFVLRMEGGPTNDPHDPGGSTRWGISQKNHPEVDLVTLTKEGAKEIYRREYWDKCGCDRLPPAVAFFLFDMSVNQGVASAVRSLQASVGAQMDGVVGPNTEAAARRLKPDATLCLFAAERAEKYARLVSAEPRLMMYVVGWMRRVMSCLKESLRIAEVA